MVKLVFSNRNFSDIDVLSFESIASARESLLAMPTAPREASLLEYSLQEQLDYQLAHRFIERAGNYLGLQLPYLFAAEECRKESSINNYFLELEHKDEYKTQLSNLKGLAAAIIEEGSSHIEELKQLLNSEPQQLKEISKVVRESLHPYIKKILKLIDDVTEVKKEICEKIAERINSKDFIIDSKEEVEAPASMARASFESLIYDIEDSSSDASNGLKCFLQREIERLSFTDLDNLETKYSNPISVAIPRSVVQQLTTNVDELFYQTRKSIVQRFWQRIHSTNAEKEIIEQEVSDDFNQSKFAAALGYFPENPMITTQPEITYDEDSVKLHLSYDLPLALSEEFIDTLEKNDKWKMLNNLADRFNVDIELLVEEVEPEYIDEATHTTATVTIEIETFSIDDKNTATDDLGEADATGYSVIYAPMSELHWYGSQPESKEAFKTPVRIRVPDEYFYTDTAREQLLDFLAGIDTLRPLFPKKDCITVMPCHESLNRAVEENAEPADTVDFALSLAELGRYEQIVFRTEFNGNHLPRFDCIQSLAKLHRYTDFDLSQGAAMLLDDSLQFLDQNDSSITFDEGTFADRQVRANLVQLNELVDIVNLPLCYQHASLWLGGNSMDFDFPKFLTGLKKLSQWFRDNNPDIKRPHLAVNTMESEYIIASNKTCCVSFYDEDGYRRAKATFDPVTYEFHVREISAGAVQTVIKTIIEKIESATSNKLNPADLLSSLQSNQPSINLDIDFAYRLFRGLKNYPTAQDAVIASVLGFLDRPNGHLVENKTPHGYTLKNMDRSDLQLIAADK